VRWFKKYDKILLVALCVYVFGWFSNNILFSLAWIFGDILPYGRYIFSIGDLCFFLSVSLLFSTLWGGLYEKN